jgi:DAK2 domain fusion protein YloV
MARTVHVDGSRLGLVRRPRRSGEEAVLVARVMPTAPASATRPGDPGGRPEQARPKPAVNQPAVNHGLRVDAEAIRRWFAMARSDLADHSAQIDALNVFPVADRDTGSNLLLTWEAACAALPAQRAGETLSEVLAPAARGALIGARGNSGAVLCQVLHGLALVLDRPTADGPGLARALAGSAAAARTALAEPVEGTIITVAQAAADAALEAGPQGVDAVLAAADAAARTALAATTSQLAALHEAGVVDAGASGFVLVLAALGAAVRNSGQQRQRLVLDARTDEERAIDLRRHGQLSVEADAPAREEVQYLLAADPAAVANLRRSLTELGDSVAIAGGPDLWHVHVHTADVGPVVEAGIATGSLSRLVVTHLDVPAAHPPARFPAGRSTRQRLVLAIAPGEGLARLFSAAGAHPLEFASRPDATALYDAMIATDARQLVLLPNDAHLISAGQQAASELRARGRVVVVVPTRSPVQGLAALAVADPHMPLSDEVVVMADAAGATRVGELSIATLTAVTSAGTCAPGDVLAMQAGDVVLVGPTLFDVARELLDRLLEGGGELVTLVTGIGASPDLAGALTAYLESTHPFAQVTVYDGGQPTHPLLVGVE